MKKTLKWLAAAAVLLLLAWAAALLWQTGFFSLSDLEQLRAYIDRFSPYSQLVFFFMQLLTVVIAPIPSNLVATAGGLAFGLLEGFLITAAAVLSGSMLTFSLARLLGRSFAEQFVSRRISEKYLTLIQTKRDTFLVLVFLFPFFPDDLICILAGLTDIPTLRFFIIILCTRLWGLLAAAALGSSPLSIPPWGIAVLVAVGLALFAMGLKYGDRIEEQLLNRLRRKKNR